MRQATKYSSYKRECVLSVAIKISKVTPSIGAVISGIDLEHCTTGEVEEIKTALHRHKVIFFRGQEGLTRENFEEFGSKLGKITKFPGSPDRSVLISNHVVGNDVWHSDATYMARVPKYCLLHALVVPREGGDTLWATTTQAYDLMPPVLKELADKLVIRHSNIGNLIELDRSGGTPAPTIETLHPLVHIIPETGEKALLLGDHAQCIPGLTRQESAAIIELFQRRIELPENFVRWSWQVGDLAVWDGRSTQHYAVPDYGVRERTIRRVWIANEELAMGVEKTKSQSITP